MWKPVSCTQSRCHQKKKLPARSKEEYRYLKEMMNAKTLFLMNLIISLSHSYLIKILCLLMSVVPIGLVEPANANNARTTCLFMSFSTVSEKNKTFFRYRWWWADFQTFWQSHLGEKQLNSQ